MIQGPNPGRHFAVAPALTVAALVALSLMLIRGDLQFERVSTVPQVSAPVTAADPVPARPVSDARADADSDAVDALAESVARRYRVSAVATRDLVEATFDEARRHKLDPLLVLAVIAVESRFNPIAQSEMGALGLMQIIPRFHVDKLAAGDDSDAMLDPQVNIRIGTQVLKEYIRRGGSEAAGLQLYNGSSDPSSTTYASKVNAERQRFAGALRKARTALREHLT